MLLVLTVGMLVELISAGIGKFWKFRAFSAAFVVTTIGLWTGFSFFERQDTLFYAITLVNIFRLINMLKIVRQNIHEDYLQRSTKRTSLVLNAILTSLLVLGILQISLTVNYMTAWAFAQFAIAATLLGVTAWNKQKTQHHTSKHFFSDKELPTVTVAIPARNETDDLASCLRTVLANDYPKLEVLVLDDCSQDRTPEIIKDFAHDGVRFIAGEPPHERWLAKNQAYDKLADHASGDIILFCGVDVRFGPHAIRSLVTSMLTKKRVMMSVLPFRIGGGVDTSLVQPLRYWWELALPRKMFNKPPVLSTCWLIKRKVLEKHGGFEAVSHNILPERYFAREAVKNGGYSFIRSDEHLDVKTVKPIEEQLATAVRVKYPGLRKRPESVLLITVFESLFLLAPLAFALSWIWSGPSTVSILGLLASLLLVFVHYIIMSASHPYHSTIALFNYPFAIATEIALTLYSMYKYEFGKVQWKGRNVCIPAMHVIKKLPKV